LIREDAPHTSVSSFIKWVWDFSHGIVEEEWWLIWFIKFPLYNRHKINDKIVFLILLWFQLKKSTVSSH
jgi:hypothetical protein